MLTADNIDATELHVNSINIDGDISWSNIDVDDGYITNITENTITTSSLLANNLKVKSANIDGILEADQITTNISQVADHLHIGSSTSDGQISLNSSFSIGSGYSGNNYITSNNPLKIMGQDDILIQSDNGNGKISLNASEIDFNYATPLHLNVTAVFG